MDFITGPMCNFSTVSNGVEWSPKNIHDLYSIGECHKLFPKRKTNHDRSGVDLSTKKLYFILNEMYNQLYKIIKFLKC